jgi:hypothetical protein
MSRPDRDHRGVAEDKLVHLLHSAHLAQVVPHLPAETLHQLIRYRGLESAGELLASATPEQVASVLDLDLWRSDTPAGDDRLDVVRFGEWLEALVEADEALAARIVASVDRRLVVAGLSRQIRVFDPATGAPHWGDEDGHAAEGPPPGLVAQVGGYLVHARGAEAWDAVIALLRALEAGHRECFHALMRECRQLSNSVREGDGLDNLLTERQQLLYDVGIEREGRRLRQGYLAPAEARAFLRAARQPSRDAAGASAALHAIATEHLRPRDQEASAAANVAEPAPPPNGTVEESIGAVGELLAEAGLLPGRPRAMLAAPGDGPSPTARMQALMDRLGSTYEAAFQARNRELAFLANVLMAGCSLDARAFTAQEASDAVVAACNLGLEIMHPGPASPDAFLADHDLVTVFQVGWQELHQLSLFVAGRLVAVLDTVRAPDRETQLGLHTLRRTLEKQRAAGTPWRARDALDVIATLDMTIWASLLGVTDECPVLPAALRATLERRTGPVSAHAFEFISTRRQVDEVHAFMEQFVDLLVR